MQAISLTVSAMTVLSASSRSSAVWTAYTAGPRSAAYFGYPRAHEDEAERSARAGLDIVDAMAELNAAIRRPPGVELAVRITVPRSRSNALSLVRKSGRTGLTAGGSRIRTIGPPRTC